MSRCFPFPPPGYEKKTRTDEVDLLKENMLALNADPVTLHWGFQKGSAILLGESHVDPTTLRGTYFQSVRPTLISPYKRVSVRKTVFLALPIPKRCSL